MKRIYLPLSAALLVVLGALSALPVRAQQASGPFSIVTVEPKGKSELSAPVPASAVKAKVGGKSAEVAGWRQYSGRGTQPDMQLVLLIDDAARTGLAQHLKELRQFLIEQPPTTEEAVIYMRNGTAAFTAPFTTNHEQVAETMRITLSGGAGVSSPYFALDDLLKRWPAHAPEERREVVMITDGVDRYSGLRYDPDNSYITSSIRDCIRNHVIVYSIYYKESGLVDRTGAGVDSGQNYLTQISQAVGGDFFYQGFSNPVDMTPFLNQINRKFANQYELRVAPVAKEKGVVDLKVQVAAPNTHTQAPQQIDMTAAQ
jgi:hypothetical protein